MFKFYVNLGAYDGDLARGVQTGINPPEFNGYYFNIGEIGTNWTIGEGHHPGQFGIGLWHQTGVLMARGVTAISAFYQFGVNNSATLPINQYYGAGLTGFGLVGGRDAIPWGSAQRCRGSTRRSSRVRAS